MTLGPQPGEEGFLCGVPTTGTLLVLHTRSASCSWLCNILPHAGAAIGFSNQQPSVVLSAWGDDGQFR